MTLDKKRKSLAQSAWDKASVCVCVCVCIDRGILARDLIPLDTSCKEAEGASRPVSFMEVNGRPMVTGT